MPVLLRELPNGPAEPIIATLAQQWKGDRNAQATRVTDPNPAVRRAALQAVACGNPPTANDLSVVADRFILDPDPTVRDEAVAAVKDYGGAVMAKLLVDRLDKVAPDRLADVVRLIAAQGKVLRDITATTATAADKMAVRKRLEQLMTHPQAAVRAAAVSQPPPPDVAVWPTPAAVRLADDPDASVRLSLAQTLRGSFAGASPTGLHLLDDTDPQVRGAAVDAVMFSSIMQSMRRPENIVAKLAECVNFPDPFVRGRLKVIPHFWTTPAAVGPFGRALAGERGPRLAALEAMAFGMPPALGPAVIKLLDDPDPITRARAFDAAGSLPLEASLAMKFARAALTDKDAFVRHAAGEALAEMSRGDVVLLPAKSPDGEPGYAHRTTDLKLPSDADMRFVTLVEAYSRRIDADRVLDLLGSDDSATVDAAIDLLRDLNDGPLWDDLKPLIDRAARRGGRAAAIIGLVMTQSTRGAHDSVRSMPDPSNALTRTLQAQATGRGRDAALAQLALRETIATEMAAARLLLNDRVPTIRAIAISYRESGVTTGLTPEELKAALEDSNPAIANQAASAVASASFNQRPGGPPPELPQPAADRLAAADATVRAEIVTESAKAAGGKPIFLTQWLALMKDPDPAVRSVVAKALLDVYAESIAIKK